MTETLYVVACAANPLLWQTRAALARAAILDWLREPNIHVTLAECAYGSRGYQLSDLAGARVTHVPLRATTMAWSKECLINRAISTLPPDALKIAALDADVTFRQAGWATKTLNALDLYEVIQPWVTAHDLGPNDEHLAAHASFASVYHSGKPVVASGAKFWAFNGGPYAYPHSGYAWAWQRQLLNRVGGLFEYGGMGSGDHHMALGMVGKVDASLPGGVTLGYRNAVMAWANLASSAINGKLGFAHGTIEHPFHGRKSDRGYESRWDMFLDHGFDPLVDLKRNTYGVLEFSGAKPDLERAFDRYLRSREEDANILT
ncbi:MAG TPA: hypothetical protein VKA12_13770 [Roseiarcus sp.]|nr:hypothetical protein [Roseiarcus sp.]